VCPDDVCPDDVCPDDELAVLPVVADSGCPVCWLLLGTVVEVPVLPDAVVVVVRCGRVTGILGGLGFATGTFSTGTAVGLGA
jgi:hypothetical protein